MLMLGNFYFSKEKRELWSVECGSEGCDAINLWHIGDPGKKGYVKLPVGSTLCFPR